MYMGSAKIYKKCRNGGKFTDICKDGRQRCFKDIAKLAHFSIFLLRAFTCRFLCFLFVWPQSGTARRTRPPTGGPVQTIGPAPLGPSRNLRLNKISGPSHRFSTVGSLLNIRLFFFKSGAFFCIFLFFWLSNICSPHCFQTFETSKNHVICGLCFPLIIYSKSPRCKT